MIGIKKGLVLISVSKKGLHHKF